MTDEVESMAWTNEVPWHGLGHQVPPNLTPQEMLKSAGLDWNVLKMPMYLEGGAKVPDAYALVRDSDKKVLDVCGNAYEPLQNHEAAQFFQEFVLAGDATMETAGSLKGGKHVWFLANLQSSFKLAGGDTVKGYLLASTPHQQGKSSVFKFTPVRVVCWNTITMALRSAGIAGTQMVRRVHRGKFDEAAQEAAKVSLGIARDQMSEFAEAALKLSKAKIDKLQAAQLIAAAFGDEELENEQAYELFETEGSKATKLAIAALTHSPGHDLKSADGTAWGVLNAITYTTDHLLRRSTDSRLFNAWFGKEARIKEKALAAILKAI